MTNAVKQLVRAALRAEMKMRAYVGVCKDDKELPKVIALVCEAIEAVQAQKNTCGASYGACVDSGCERQVPTQPSDKIDEVANIILCAADDRGVHLEDHPAVGDRNTAKALAQYVAIAVVNEAMNETKPPAPSDVAERVAQAVADEITIQADGGVLLWNGDPFQLDNEAIAHAALAAMPAGGDVVEALKSLQEPLHAWYVNNGCSSSDEAQLHVDAHIAEIIHELRKPDTRHETVGGDVGREDIWKWVSEHLRFAGDMPCNQLAMSQPDVVELVEDVITAATCQTDSSSRNAVNGPDCEAFCPHERANEVLRDAILYELDEGDTTSNLAVHLASADAIMKGEV